MYVVLEQGGEEEERASVDNYKTGGRDQQQGRRKLFVPSLFTSFNKNKPGLKICEPGQDGVAVPTDA